MVALFILLTVVNVCGKIRWMLVRPLKQALVGFFPSLCAKVPGRIISLRTTMSRPSAIMLESVPTFELLDGKGSVEVDDFGVGSKKCRTIRLAQGIDVPKITKSAFDDHCVEYHLPFLTETEVEL